MGVIVRAACVAFACWLFPIEMAAAQPANVPMPVAPLADEEKHPKLEQFVDQNGRLHLKTSVQ